VTAIAVGRDERVLAWDRVTPTLRLYSADGGPERIIGREGSGPGEYLAEELHDVAAHRDGRWLVWDGDNARINVYRSDGAYDTMWRLVGETFASGGAMFADAAGRVWLESRTRPVDGRATGGAWIRLTENGNVLDTLYMPAVEGADPYLSAGGDGYTVSYAAPYGRIAIAGATELGGIMWALSAPYVIHVQHEARLLRVEGEWAPVPIPEEERVARRAYIEQQLRRVVQAYTWNGAGIPHEMPPIRALLSGMDGRLWVELYNELESYQREPRAGEGTAPIPAYRAREKRWDVFGSDGRFVGRVRADRTIRLLAMRGDFAWGAQLDDNDVPILVKWRVVPGF
jgi:hypothetical protein